MAKDHTKDDQMEPEATGPAARARRIQQIKAAIADGSYHVPADELADKLLRSALKNPAPPDKSKDPLPN